MNRKRTSRTWFGAHLDTAPERGCAESQPQRSLFKATAGMREDLGIFPLLRLVLRTQPRSFPKYSAAARPRYRAFTLIELLVVITIIGILASMTLVVIAKVRESGRKVEAKREIHMLLNAIAEYHSDTGAYPVSDQSLATAIAAHGDLTFSAGFGLPGIFPNNSEVMAILLNRERYPSGAPTVNFNHAKNKRQKFYLSGIAQADTADLPGLGPDLVFRDPWGSPYIISFDLNFDENCQDAFYRLARVSQDTSGSGSESGLTSPDPGGATDNYFYRGGVMIWSRGPDKNADPKQNFNVPPNRDNIVSWR